jgi:flagellar motor switch protein FliM
VTTRKNDSEVLAYLVKRMTELANSLAPRLVPFLGNDICIRSEGAQVTRILQDACRQSNAVWIKGDVTDDTNELLLSFYLESSGLQSMASTAVGAVRNIEDTKHRTVSQLDLSIGRLICETIVSTVERETDILVDSRNNKVNLHLVDNISVHVDVNVYPHIFILIFVFDNTSVTITLAVHPTLFKRIFKRLSAPRDTLATDNWSRNIRRSLLSIPTNVTATLAQTRYTLADIKNFSLGNTILLEGAGVSDVVLSHDDHALFQCTIGKQEQFLTVRVDKNAHQSACNSV